MNVFDRIAWTLLLYTTVCIAQFKHYGLYSCLLISIFEKIQAALTKHDNALQPACMLNDTSDGDIGIV